MVYCVPGVGVRTDNFARPDQPSKQLLRQQLGIDPDALVVVSVGELNRNKNHEVIIRAIAQLRGFQAVYVICGHGPQHDHLVRLAAGLGISAQVKFLGYRNDISAVLGAADVFAHPSFREGLPVAVIEAMSTGLPCLVSQTRGNVDLIQHNSNGFRVQPRDVHGFAEALMLLRDPVLRQTFGDENMAASKAFDSAEVSKIMRSIYVNTLGSVDSSAGSPSGSDTPNGSDR